MKLFKKPAFAVLLVLLLVVSSTLLSADRKLNSSCNKVTDGFYSGFRFNGSLHPSIAGSLKELASISETMSAIGSNYGMETEALSSETAALRKSLAAESRDAEALYAQYDSIYSKLLLLENDLNSSGLSARHSEQMQQLSADLLTVKSDIDQAGYNERVTSFLRENDRFPTRQFANLFHIAFPTYFA